MKIQTRQSLYSSIAFGVIFIIISFLIYVLYSKNAQKAVSKNLEKTAYLVAFFYLEEDELNTKEYAKIKKQFDEVVSGTSYQVYNDSNTVMYGNRDMVVQSSVLADIKLKGFLKFTTATDYCHGIYYEDNQGDFIIITKESKDMLNDQLIALLWILVSALIVGLIAVILLSRWLAKIAYKPFSNVIDQVRSTSLNDADFLINSPNTKDELQELTETFNHLLERISETFIIQKNFVSYVSHEFKTPLAAMLGNLEVFVIKDRTPQEYTELSTELIEQIHQLEEILNTLIVISDLRQNSEIHNCVRIDELIWEIVAKVSINYAGNRINVEIDVLPEDESLLIVNKDRTQLLMALFNIIENAVKYSQGEKVNLKIYKEKDLLYLSVIDKGIGIPAEDLKHINEPFHRAQNTKQIHGCGIGLSIALRILDKNNVVYRIESEINVGTKVFIIFEKND